MTDEPEGEKRRKEDIQREDARHAHDRIHAFWENVNDATIKSGDATLRAALLINGGAAVSVLAFLGGLVSQGRIELKQLSDVSSALVLFAYGVTAAVLGMGLTYLTNFVTAAHARSHVQWWQYPYLRDGTSTWKWAALKKVLHTAALLTGIASILLFVFGMLDVRESIVRLAITK